MTTVTLPAAETASPAANLDSNPPASSPGPNAETAPAAPAPASEAVKSDPPAEPAVQTPLDITRKVLSVTPKPPADAPAAADVKSPDAPAAAPTEPNDADDEKLPFNRHPRWQKFKADHKELETKFQAAQTQLETLKALEEPAENYRQIDAFLTSNNLTPQEAATGYTVMAMMRNEPEKALPVLRDMVAQLEVLTGSKLPADLDEQVNQGAITEDAAQMVARTRLDLTRTQAERDQAVRQHTETVAQSQTRLRTEMRDAVYAEEMRAKAIDPDWARKQPLIQGQLVAMLQTEKPATAQAAVELFKRAVGQVDAALKPPAARIVPLPPRAELSSTMANSAPATVPPKSGLDVVRSVLGR